MNGKSSRNILPSLRCKKFYAITFASLNRIFYRYSHWVPLSFQPTEGSTVLQNMCNITKVLARKKWDTLKTMLRCFHKNQIRQGTSSDNHHPIHNM